MNISDLIEKYKIEDPIDSFCFVHDVISRYEGIMCSEDNREMLRGVQAIINMFMSCCVRKEE